MVVAVLGASLLHASWHGLIKSSGDRVVALAGMNVVSAGVALACMPFVQVPSTAALAVIACSVFLHGGYKIALAQLYRRADLGQAYPLARGITPLMATALGLAFLAEKPSMPTLAGVALVSAGLVVLVLERGAQRLSAGTVGTAVVAGGAVAAYSVLDAYGVRLNADWAGFTVWLVALDGLAFVGYALATRGRVAIEAWTQAPARVLVSGGLGVVSFGVFMWALGRAQVGAVTALRETSVLFAALIGAWVLKERTGRARYAAAGLVMLGVMVIAAGR